MKSRKVKAAAKSKAYISKKKLKGNIPLDASDSGSDVDSDSFYHDEIDDFHKKQNDELSTDDELIQHKEESSEEEEVLPITDDETDESSEVDLDKDESDEDKDNEDLPNLDAWGKKKSMYYDADFVDEDRGKTYREEDAEAAKAEEEEAVKIQKSVLSNISANNLGANLFLEGSSESSSEDEREEENLSTAPKHEKIKFLKKTHPEMFNFIEEFKTSIQEIYEKLLPLLELINKGKLPLEACAKYIKLKYHILLHYSTNISFYMTLKSSGSKINHHPVLQRIQSFKKLLDELKPVDEVVKDDIDIITNKLSNNEEIIFNNSESIKPPKTETQRSKKSNDVLIPSEENAKNKTSKRKHVETEVEKEIISHINEVKEDAKKRKADKSDESLSEDENESMPNQNSEKSVEEKRTITYQIAKNKGLVPHRKKEYRNPRVRHRMKYRKAKIRRKGQVREVIKEVKRYEGEPTGISTHVIKSIKLK